MSLYVSGMGLCPSGVLVEWGYVQWGFVQLPCCQVTNPPVGCFVLIEVNVIVDEIKIFFAVFLIKNLINCHCIFTCC